MTLRSHPRYILAASAIALGYAAGHIAETCLGADISHTLGAVLLAALAVWGVANVCRLHVGKVASRNAARKVGYGS